MGGIVYETALQGVKRDIGAWHKKRLFPMKGTVLLHITKHLHQIFFVNKSLIPVERPFIKFKKSVILIKLYQFGFVLAL